MGLEQDFRFKYESKEQIIVFLNELISDESLQINGDHFEIKGINETFTFEGHIETYGLRCHRSGNYFDFLGKFVELATGKFESINIEDK